MTAVLRKLETVLPRHSLLTIYKAFLRPHLDYCDVIYDKIFNESWHKKLESAQYNVALAITVAIRGTDTEKLYQELGVESLPNRHKLRRLSLFYKIYKDQSPLYLFNLIPAKTPGNYPLQNVKEIPAIKVKHRFFENSFFPATITKGNDLDYSFCNASSINFFKKNILKFIRLGPNKVFNIYNPYGLKLLTRLHLSLSHLRGHKFNHNFSDCLDEICICGKDIESTNHFLLQCSLFLNERQVLMNKIRDTDSLLIDQNENSLCYILPFGKENMNDSENSHILQATIEYILSTERFNILFFE